MTWAPRPLAGPPIGACGAVYGMFSPVRSASVTRIWCSERDSGLFGVSFSAAC